MRKGVSVIDMTGCLGNLRMLMGQYFIEKADENGYFENPEKVCVLTHRGARGWLMTVKEFKKLVDINGRRKNAVDEVGLNEFVCALDIPDDEGRGAFCPHGHLGCPIKLIIDGGTKK